MSALIKEVPERSFSLGHLKNPWFGSRTNILSCFPRTMETQIIQKTSSKSYYKEHGGVYKYSGQLQETRKATKNLGLARQENSGVRLMAPDANWLCQGRTF